MVIAVSRLDSAVIVAMSILGIITSRVIVSEKSSTDSIRSCSYSSASVESTCFFANTLPIKANLLLSDKLTALAFVVGLQY